MPPCLASPLNDDKNVGMTMDDNSHTALAVVGDGDGGGLRKVLFCSSDNASDTVSVANNKATSATSTTSRSLPRSPTISISLRKRKAASAVQELQTDCEEGMYWSVGNKRPSSSSSSTDPVESKLSNETTIVTQPSNISDSTAETEEQSVTSSVMRTTTTASKSNGDGDDGAGGSSLRQQLAVRFSPKKQNTINFADDYDRKPIELDVYECDECSIKIILGERYHCKECDYDLCHECGKIQLQTKTKTGIERTKTHEHEHSNWEIIPPDDDNDDEDDDDKNSNNVGVDDLTAGIYLKTPSCS